jgi:predicted acyltransferase
MAKGSNRLVSLDIFRGLTVVFMIIVNTPGSWKYVYTPLKHASWHGCTPTDLVFPFFLFIVGVSTYYSLKKYGSQINSSSVFRIFRRMVAIFAIGLFLNIFPYFGRDYSTLRIMGVLQRIALAYGIGAIICMAVRREYLWIITAVILLSYWGILAFFGSGDPYSLETNFALTVDGALLGNMHMYKGFGIPFDPEGLLSTIPSICTVIIGYFIGGMIGNNSSDGKSAVKLLLVGAAAVGLGYFWGMFFPLNKPLWTSSYVLYTAGIAIIVLAIIYLITDVLKIVKWATFFKVFGMNALFTFSVSIIWTKIMLYIIKIQEGSETINLYNWIYIKVCVPVAGNLNGSLLFALLQVFLAWSIAYVLYKKKIFIKL